MTMAKNNMTKNKKKRLGPPPREGAWAWAGTIGGALSDREVAQLASWGVGAARRIQSARARARARQA